MASIYKRKDKFCVVYRYTDSKGHERQKWETFNTNSEAKKRKAEVEYKMSINTFVVPNCVTIEDLLVEYVSVYGVNKWAVSTYNSNKSLIENYILPYIGKKKIEECTPQVMDRFYLGLQKVRAVARPNQKAPSPYVTSRTIRDIHKLLRSAFNQAVRWELVLRNPVEYATLPKVENHPREIWTPNELTRALNCCKDKRLKLCINLAFSCSLRIGELLALTWDCIHINPESIANGTSFLRVEKELQRADKKTMDKLDKKDIKFQFPNFKPFCTTVLVLKSPKTQSSVRRVYLPQAVAESLLEVKTEQDRFKDLLGSEYYNFNLVIASEDGRPVEGQAINRQLKFLIKENDLPQVVFHSLRHTSVTYKLKLNGGDIKSVQGDTGHAQINMVTDVYSHIMDEDRCKNAQKLQNAFYGNGEETSLTEPVLLEDKNKKLLELVNQRPEIMDLLLKTLGGNQPK